MLPAAAHAVIKSEVDFRPLMEKARALQAELTSYRLTLLLLVKGDLLDGGPQEEEIDAWLYSRENLPGSCGKPGGRKPLEFGRPEISYGYDKWIGPVTAAIECARNALIADAAAEITLPISA
jgi:hypothetical protein